MVCLIMCLFVCLNLCSVESVFAYLCVRSCVCLFDYVDVSFWGVVCLIVCVVCLCEVLVSWSV